MSDSCMGGHL